MITVNSQLQSILKSKESRPIMRAEVFDTANSFPSNGWFVRYYSACASTSQNDPGSGFLCRTQFEDKIFNDYSNGVPTALSNYVGFSFNASGVGTGDPYMISWSGYFFSDLAGSYSFATRAYGKTRVFVGNTFTDVLSGTTQTSGLSTRNNWNSDQGKGTYFSGIAVLGTGWYPIKVDYGFPGGLESGVNQCFISAYYTPPNGVETVLSCSKVSPSGAFLDPISLGNLMQLMEDTNESDCQYTFEVPIVGGDAYQWNLGRESFGNLKPNNLVKIYAGYATESGYAQTNGYTTNLQSCTDYVQRFIGFIDNISVAQNFQSLTATVKCRDFSKKLISAINENFPNFASYSRDVLNRIDRAGTFNLDQYMPNAYDKWYLIDVIRDLCIHAGIDPTYINETLISIGNYYRLEHNLSWPQKDYIDENGIFHLDGDPFNFRFTYGDKISDIINKVCDLIGYTFRFNENGSVFIKDPRYTKRIECFETSGVNSQAVIYSGAQYSPFFSTDCSNRLFMCNVSGNLNQGDLLVDQNSVAVWNFENNTIDSSPKGYALSGTVPFISSPTPPQGSFAVGPFSRTGFYSMPTNLITDLQTLNKFSVQFYAFPSNLVQNDKYILSFKEAYNTEDSFILRKDGSLDIQFDGVSHRTIPGVVRSGVWSHVAVEFDPTNLNIFVNNTGIYTTAHNWRLGKYGPIQSGRIGKSVFEYNIDSVCSGLFLDQLRISKIYGLSPNYPTGVYPTTDTSNIVSSTSANISFSGVGCSLWYSTPLAGGYNRVDIYRNSDNTRVLTTGFTMAPAIHYGQKFFVTNTLPKDSYKCTIVPSGNTLLKFEALEYYEKNIYQPDYYFRANEDIVTLNLELTDEDLRNEVIVVGQQTSNKQYVYGRAVDLDSMANPQAFNYAGGKRTFVLVEPRLQSQQRVDWLSSSILDRYRKNKRIMTLGCIGNPSLQQGDVIGIKSTKVGIDTESNIFNNTSGMYTEDVLDVFYVQKINSQTDQDKYLTNITVSSLPPVDSWRTYLPITTQLLSGFINLNGHIFTNFSLVTKNSTDNTAYDALSDASCFIKFDSVVDLDRLWVFVDDRSIESVAYQNRFQIQVAHEQTPLGTIKNWLVNVGDFVLKGQALCTCVTVEVTPKAFTIYSDYTGGISAIFRNSTAQGGSDQCFEDRPGCSNIRPDNWIAQIDTGAPTEVVDSTLATLAIKQFEGNTALLDKIKSHTWNSQELVYNGVTLPGSLVWIHNGGGELWGTITLPTAMETNVGGGNFKGQNSTNIARLDGTYPMAIWGIGTDDSGKQFGTELGLWHPPTSTSDSVVVGGNNYPALKVKNTPTNFTAYYTPYNNNTFLQYAGGDMYTNFFKYRFSTNNTVSLIMTSITLFGQVRYNFYLQSNNWTPWSAYANSPSISFLNGSNLNMIIGRDFTQSVVMKDKFKIGSHPTVQHWFMNKSHQDAQYATGKQAYDIDKGDANGAWVGEVILDGFYTVNFDVYENATGRKLTTLSQRVWYGSD